jgi:uncharacterized damage-inducible protein DinB
MDTYPDLFAHQQWADAVHWRTLAEHPRALEDESLRKRLHHLHSVQRAFLDVWKGGPGSHRLLESFASMQELRQFVRGYYRELFDFLETATPARLHEILRVPWFPEPQRPVRISETMFQVVLHSEHHRGQNAVRLRELGGVMPTTDYIVWILENRPAPIWD